MHEYQIERLSQDNLHHLSALYQASYGKSVPHAFFEKKYDTKRFGAEWVGYFALTRDQQPAGFYGIIPCQFKIHDAVLLAAQSADTMTHPAHRKKGLFVTLARKTYALAQAENIHFVFGFPNQHSYPGFVKLGWNFLPKPMQYFTLKGSAFPLASLFVKIPGIKSLYDNTTMSAYSAQTLTSLPSDDVGTLRDGNFLHYKKGYSTTFKVEWPKAEGWMKNDGVLKVGYIHLKQKTSSEELKKYLTSTAKKLGCRNIILMTSEESELYKVVSKVSPPLAGLPIGFYNLTDRNLDFSQARFEYCDIDIF